MDRITGKESPEERYLAFNEIVVYLTSQISGNSEQRARKVVILEEACCHVLSQVLFNVSLARAEGDIKKVPSFMLAHMDDIKESINDLCAQNVVLYNNGKITLAADENGNPIKLKQ